MNALQQLPKVIPSLKIIADDEAAAKLRELLKDADDGFRRVVKVGLYIEWIAANLAHGQLIPWMQAHCPEVSQRTIYNWRSLAKNLCDWANLKFASLANLPVSGDKLLDYPVNKLPPALQKCRVKMDEALSESKSARQLFLFLGFKQAEIDPITGYPRAKRGRHKGSSGCTREMRLKAKFANEHERLIAMQTDAEKIAPWLLENCNLNGFARMDEVPGGAKSFAQFADAISQTHLFLSSLKKAVK